MRGSRVRVPFPAQKFTLPVFNLKLFVIMKHNFLLSFVAIAAGVFFAQCTSKKSEAPAEPIVTATDFRIVEDGGTGPFKAVMQEEPSLEMHTIFCPQDLQQFGESNPLPVVVWGNGACYNSPFEHYLFLNEIASHGYIIVASGYMPKEDEPYKFDTIRSTPDQQIESIDWILAQNEDKNSPYYQKVDTKHILAAGMSCGGLQTLENSADPRLSGIMICNSGLFSNPAGAVPGMPMPEKEKLNDIKVPVIYILGGPEDIAYENGMDDFHRIQHVPAFAANFPVGHGGTYAQPNGGEFAVVATAWLDWQTKGSEEAAKMFLGDPCGLSQREGWTTEKNDLLK